MYILFLFCCTYTHFKYASIGYVDSVDSNVCTLQLKNGDLKTFNSKLCLYLKEGDEIKVLRKK